MLATSSTWADNHTMVTYRVLKIANFSFFELSLQRQVFRLEENTKTCTVKHMANISITKIPIFKRANHVLL